MKYTIMIAAAVSIAAWHSAEAGQNNVNNKSAPQQQRQAPRQIPRPNVIRPQMQNNPQRVGMPQMHRQPMNGHPGVNNLGGRAMMGSPGAYNRMQGTPRGQLQQMVRPVGAMPVGRAPMHVTPAHLGHVPVHANFTRPGHIRHNPAHREGHAGERFHHEAFAFRRGGHFFHRRYYAVGAAWYWYDEPFSESDPEFAMVDTEGLPVCEPEADECQ
jgi:hypothetical protein